MIRQNQFKVMIDCEIIHRPALRRNERCNSHIIPGCRLCIPLRKLNLFRIFPSCRELQIQIHTLDISLPACGKGNLWILLPDAFGPAVILSLCQCPVHQIHTIGIHHRNQIQRKLFKEKSRIHTQHGIPSHILFHQLLRKPQQHRRCNILIGMKRGIIAHLSRSLSQFEIIDVLAHYASPDRPHLDIRILCHKIVNDRCQKLICVVLVYRNN